MSLNPLQGAALHKEPALESFETTDTLRTNRPIDNPNNNGGLFQPQVLETTRRSNRTTLVRKLEEVLSEAPGQASTRAPSPTGERLEKKSLASSIFFPKESPKTTTGTQTPDYFSIKQIDFENRTGTNNETLPKPVETIFRFSRKEHAPVDIPKPASAEAATDPAALPPTPPHVEPLPDALLPKPFEVSRRSNRPLARPLVIQPAEEAPKSNLSRKPDMTLDLSRLPQPVSTTRWGNRVSKPGARHLRRSSTAQPPGTPGLYYFVPETGLASATPVHTVRGPGKWVRPVDHVEHLGEPVDSAPPSPDGSPKGSRCPSLSSSPTSSTDNLPITLKRAGADGRRDSWEEGYAGYMLNLQRRKHSGPKSPKSPPRKSGLRQEQKLPESTSAVKPVPVMVTDKFRRDSEAPDSASIEREKEYLRAKARGGTVRPMKIDIPAAQAQKKVYDEYPIFASPKRESFLPAPERVPTKDLTEAKPIPVPPTLPTQSPPPGKDSPRIDLDDNKARGNLAPPTTTGNLPTPPDSNPTSQQATMLSFGRIKIPLVGIFYPSSIHNYHHPAQPLPISHAAPYQFQYHAPQHNPSPGITVASLPPRTSTKTANPKLVPTKPGDVTDEFVKEVWSYLSFEHECIARKYDGELAQYTGLGRDVVTRDRFAALREYVKLWVGTNPEVDGGEKMKGGLW